LRRRCRRNEKVRAIEEDRIHLLGRHETRDVDGSRRGIAVDRLEVGFLDDDELSLGNLPAFDDLVRANVDLVERAPTLLLDRRLALAVQQPE
jgi:hypothetical protein